MTSVFIAWFWLLFLWLCRKGKEYGPDRSFRPEFAIVMPLLQTENDLYGPELSVWYPVFKEGKFTGQYLAPNGKTTMCQRLIHQVIHDYSETYAHENNLYATQRSPSRLRPIFSLRYIALSIFSMILSTEFWKFQIKVSIKKKP